MRRLGGFSYKLAETQRPRLALDGLGKQPLLPNEKDARGSYKKPEELLTALSLRAEARGLFLQTLPRPSDLGSHARARQAPGLLLHPKRKQATQARSHGSSECDRVPYSTKKKPLKE